MSKINILPYTIIIIINNNNNNYLFALVCQNKTYIYTVIMQKKS